MSAPLLAGFVALVRQYFTEGFYPTGRRAKDDEFSPSGSLMKAVTIASAVEMRGTRLSNHNEGSYELYSFENASFPNNHQGWGRPQLDRVLEFADDPASAGFHLHIPSFDSRRVDTFGDDSFNSSGEVVNYSFCSPSATRGVPAETALVRIALVWTDAPGTPSADVVLVNDIDLEVYLNGQKYIGNGGDAADRLNPVEVVQLEVDSQFNNDIQVRVVAHKVNIGPQPFSVVVVGPVRGVMCSDLLAGGPIDDGKEDIAQ
jgi:hypothetical protein